LYNKLKIVISIFLIISVSASIQVFGFPWNFDMWKQKSVKPYEMPVVYPKNTITTDGLSSPEDRAKLESITTNRLVPSKLDLTVGKQLYDINCAVCHGLQGNGDGPVIKKGFYPVNLKTQRAKDFKDGYIFAYIRYGGKVMMPSYRENISKEQAWQVVNYVRHLQSQSN